MHIKKVIIKGFKSYQDKVVIESFEKGLNVVVGRNGTGKSNFLSALQMILADEEYRKRNRKSLLEVQRMAQQNHEPSYIEIIFDNEDGFFPEDSAEVSLKRTMNGKKDKFFVNGKRIERFDKYLTQVGLVTPYSFVQQGRINQLATMNDETRLNVLKVVSGETGWKMIYLEITNLLRESNLLFVHILETTQRFQNLKPELKDQMTQLAAHTEASNERYSAELVIQSRELERIQTSLSDLEENKTEFSNSLQQLKEDSKKYDFKRDKLNLRISRKTRKLKQLETEIESEQKKFEKLKEESGKLELEIEDYSNPNARNAREEQTPEDIQAERTRIQTELDKIITICQKLEENEKNLTLFCSRNNIRIKQVTNLMTKLGGRKRFEGPAEEELFMKETDQKLQETRLNAVSKVKEFEKIVENVNAAMAKVKKQIVDYQAERATHVKALQQIINNICQLEEEKHVLEEANKLNSNEAAILEEKLQSTREQLDQIHEKMYKSIGSGGTQSFLGMKVALDSIAKKENFDPVKSGYYGTVLENIEWDDEYDIPVQVGGGAKLFYHVVANNAVGLKLLNEFNRLKQRSEVRFIAMDRLIELQEKYPKDKQITPLIKHIKFSDEVLPAMKFVFGKILCCATAQIASRAAKEYNLTCITNDGDKYSPSGVIAGGYRDSQKFKGLVNFIKERRKLTNQLQNWEDKISALEQTLRETNNDILLKNRVIEENELKRERINATTGRILEDISLLQDKLKDFQRLLPRDELTLNSAKETLAAAQEELKFFDEVRKNLGPVNGSTLKKWKDEMKKDENSLNDARRKLKAKKERKILLEIALRKLADVQLNGVKNASQESSVQDLMHSRARGKLESVKTSILELEGEMKAENQALINTKAEILQINGDLETLSEVDQKCKQEVLAAELNLAKAMEKCFEYQNKLLKTNETLQELRSRSYPFEHIDYSNRSNRRVYKILQKAREKLNEINANGFVNLRAAEQYKEARELVKGCKRKAKYFETCHNRISGMVADIEKDKSGICVETIRKVQESFKNIFQELVLSANGAPGHGQLTAFGDGFEFNETSSVDEGRKQWEENAFLGASLKVNFTNVADTMTDILQLSGGQKSIVALAFLLAIQNANPQALYVFDEVDQALDPSFREAVGKKMKELANHAQFVCSTFRKEFVEFADSFLGVGFNNQRSFVRAVTREEALNFVQPDSTEDSSTIDESLLDSTDQEQGSRGA